jgi:peptidoglycan/xylan/chitin deacetylase (PgdA/CDA1 family)
VFCALGIDTVSGNPTDAVLRGLDRAAAEGTVIQLFTHSPGRTIAVSKVEAILAHAASIGLDFVTYPELGPGQTPRGGLALSFDDAGIDTWIAMRDTFLAHDAQVTFFVKAYDVWTEPQKTDLARLAGDGHAVQAHSLRHQRATDYVTDHGLAAYLADEALPSIALLEADGYVVTDYAYPFGARTSELDRALLEHVERVRAVTFALDGPLLADPCPE